MAEGLEFGVDWYPEQWDESLWARDADRMKEAGFTIARIMEFAWAIIEPEPGRFDFSLFDRAIDALASRGIGVVLGTPTATFPAWLADLDPGVFALHPSGYPRDFGARRMGCWNSETYRARSMAVVRAIADRYGKDGRIRGFQVDNELGHEGSDRCVCPNCARAWPAWLERRYGSVDRLNRDWGAVFWGTSYSRFGQVPLPRDQVATGHNPALLVDYLRFCSDTACSYAAEQVDILRAACGGDKWITTNLYPPPLSTAIDNEKMCEGMDFASWDNYPVWGDQDEPYPWQFVAFLESYVRGLRGDRPFTVMEEMSGIQGHVCLGHLPPEQRVALWTDQAIARGANRIVYFRWRTAAFAQEQLCYGLLDADDEPTERARVLFANMREAKRKFGEIASTLVPAEACLAYDKDNLRLLRDQYLTQAMKIAPNPWAQAGCDSQLAQWFAPLATFGVGTDVSSVKSLQLDKYRLISLPLYQMTDGSFVERLDAWVREGGTLVLGWRAGARDSTNRSIGSRLPGAFAKMAGVRVPRFESLNHGKVGVRVGLLRGEGSAWADLIEPEGARVVARYSDRRKFYSGLPCATVNEYGKGRVYYLGTTFETLAMVLVYGRIFKSAGLDARFLGADLERVPRTDGRGETRYALLNHSPKARRALGARLPPWGSALVGGGRK
jgi:beta-galactosidase